MPSEQFYSTELMKDLTSHNAPTQKNGEYKILLTQSTTPHSMIVLDYINKHNADTAYEILQKISYINVIKMY